MRTIKTLMLSCCLAALTAPAFAQGYKFPGGTGTANDPYQIKTAEDLNHVRDFLSNSSVCFKMMNDIDLAEFLGEGSWAPIGNTPDNAFEGTFDGGNFTIKNMNCSGGASGLGLFGRIQTPGVVKNFKMDNANVSGADWCGIVASTNGNWQKRGGKIINVHVTNSYIEGNSCIGAIAGVNDGSLENCSAINTDVDGVADAVGGLIGTGASANPYTRIYNCTYSGNVASSGGASVGGIAGDMTIPSANDAPSCFQNNAVYGNVTGRAAVGGLIGYQGSDQSILDNNFSCATITGYQAGGLFGSPLGGLLTNSYCTGDVNSFDEDGKGGKEPWSGGIVAAAYKGIKGCYFSGTITGKGRMGGIAGRNWGTLVVSNCYYNKDGATQNMGEGNDEAGFDAKGLTLQQMMSLSTMKFTEADKWQVQEGKTTPYFKNQTNPVTIDKIDLGGASGSYTGNVNAIYFASLDYGGISDVQVTFDNGKWSAVWPEETVVADDYIRVFAIEDGKMPSLPTTAKVANSNSIRNLNSAAGKVYVVVSEGQIKATFASSDVASYTLNNVAGATLLSGNVAGSVSINTSSFAKGLYLFTASQNGSTNTYKVLVK